MKKETNLSSIWKEKIKKAIQNGDSPFDLTQYEILDGKVRMDLASPGIQQNMIRLLKKDAVDAAGAYLLKRTEGHPAVQKMVPTYIHRSLYWIAWAIQDHHREPLASEIRAVTKTLEQVRNDDRLYLYMGKKGDEFRSMLAHASGWYRGLESSAQRTKPRDTGQRLALSMLRIEFVGYFGKPMNEAVLCLMQAAFGKSTWKDVEHLRIRASQWRC